MELSLADFAGLSLTAQSHLFLFDGAAAFVFGDARRPVLDIGDCTGGICDRTEVAIIDFGSILTTFR